MKCCPAQAVFGGNCHSIDCKNKKALEKYKIKMNVPVDSLGDWYWDRRDEVNIV